MLFIALKSNFTRVLGSLVRRRGMTVKKPNIIEYIRDYLAGSYHSMLVRWIKEGKPYDPTAIGKLHTFLLINNVDSLAKMLSEE